MKWLIRSILAILGVVLIVNIWLLILFGREDITEVRRWRYDKDVVLKFVRISAGGAWGNEIYRVSSIFQGDERQFFEGTAGQGFAVQRAGRNAILITLCDGIVSHAEPIWLDRPGERPIHLRLKLDCDQRP